MEFHGACPQTPVRGRSSTGRAWCGDTCAGSGAELLDVLLPPEVPRRSGAWGACSKSVPEQPADAGQLSLHATQGRERLFVRHTRMSLPRPSQPERVARESNLG